MAAKGTILNGAIHPRAVALVMSTTFAVAALMEWGAYMTGVRAEARATAHNTLPSNYCVTCHSDAKTLKLMLEKDDNNGTSAYCAGVRLPTKAELAADTRHVIRQKSTSVSVSLLGATK
jgi:hypothetical protein